MSWFSTQAERHPEFARIFGEEVQRETVAFIATVQRKPCYGYEYASVNATARTRAINRVKALRSFNNETR